MNPFLDLLDAVRTFPDSVAASLILAAASGFLGVHVVLRRSVFIGFALSQVAAVGVALSFLLETTALSASLHHIFGGDADRCHMAFAVMFEILAVIGLTLAGKRRGRAPELLLGVTWVGAGAASILLVAAASDAHGLDEMRTLLTGDLLGVGPGDLRLLLLVLLPVLFVTGLFVERMVFVAFDVEMARALGIRTGLWDLLLYLALGALFAVSLRMTGTLFSFAYLVLPAAAALRLARRPVVLFAVAVGVALLSGALGFIASWELDLPAGPAAAAAVFLVYLVVLLLPRRA